MRILHTEASCGWGGQEIRILEESRGLIERGHEAVVACPPHARMAEEAARYDVPVVPLPIEFRSFAGFIAIRRHLEEGGYDVVNTHSSADSWLVALACATLSDAPPIVRTRHISAPIPNNMSSRWLYQSATSLIVTTGEALRQQLINNNGFDPARIVSVTTGMDVDRYVPGDKESAKRKLGIPGGQFLYGIVATLRFQKGHAELLRAFAAQNDPSCNLAIVGDGPQLQNINALIAELGLAERILMPGNQHDILPWYQAFDAFVLPTHAEGMPQSLMQAMLCALPVITTPVGSIPSVVEHEQTGLLISPKNISELSAAMRRVRLDPILRQRLGASARETALARFDIKRMLDDMECLFHKVAKGATCH